MHVLFEKLGDANAYVRVRRVWLPEKHVRAHPGSPPLLPPPSSLPPSLPPSSSFLPAFLIPRLPSACPPPPSAPPPRPPEPFDGPHGGAGVSQGLASEGSLGPPGRGERNPNWAFASSRPKTPPAEARRSLRFPCRKPSTSSRRGSVSACPTKVKGVDPSTRGGSTAQRAAAGPLERRALESFERAPPTPDSAASILRRISLLRRVDPPSYVCILRRMHPPSYAMHTVHPPSYAMHPPPYIYPPPRHTACASSVVCIPQVVLGRPRSTWDDLGRLGTT